MAQMLRVPALIPALFTRQPQQSSATCPHRYRASRSPSLPKSSTAPGSSSKWLVPITGLWKLSISCKKQEEGKEQGQLLWPSYDLCCRKKQSMNLQISVMCCTCFPLCRSKECCQESTSIPGEIKLSSTTFPLLSLQRWDCHGCSAHLAGSL